MPKISFCIIIISREEEIAINTEFAKKIAYDLTMEYFHQNNLLKIVPHIEIADQVENFNKRYDEFYNAIIKNHSTNL